MFFYVPCLIRNAQLWQPLHNLHRLQTNRDHLPNQPDNILLIIRAVWVIDDAAPFVRLDTILIYYPLQRRPIPKPIFKRLCWYLIEHQEIVVLYLRIVFEQLHLFDAPIERRIRCLNETQRICVHLLIADVNLPQPLPRFGKRPEIWCVWQVRQIPLEIRLIPFPICRVMEETVDIMKDIPLADRVIPVMRPELCQRPIGDASPDGYSHFRRRYRRGNIGFFQMLNLRKGSCLL